MLAINDPQFQERAEIIWEKGTNRSSFFRGEVDKYGWVDIGSSFLPSELISSFLWAQLENLRVIQQRRTEIWNLYFQGLETWAHDNNIGLPSIPSHSTNNAHMFYLVFENIEERDSVIKKLKKNNVLAVFHYLSLHKSEFYRDKHGGRELVNSDSFSNCLVRLPMFFELEDSQIEKIIKVIKSSI